MQPSYAYQAQYQYQVNSHYQQAQAEMKDENMPDEFLNSGSQHIMQRLDLREAHFNETNPNRHAQDLNNSRNNSSILR